MGVKNSARIVGMGSYVPTKILKNSDLEKMVETNDEWIVSRTGIRERRIAEPDECASHMGSKAAEKAFQNCSVQKQDIDCLIVATMTPDYLAPCTGAVIQAQLELPAIPTMDVQAACTGFIYAISLAKAYVNSGMYKNVLVIASEKMSTVVDYTDRNICVLFGDGASAAIISGKGKGLEIGPINLGTDGSLAELVYVPAGGSRIPASVSSVESKQHYIVLNGREVFKHAVRRMASAAEECLQSVGLQQGDLAWLVPHQANERIIDAIAKSLDFPTDKIYKTVHKYGNTSASSVPIALDELQRVHPLKKKDHVLLVAFGAGLTWGAAILTAVEE
jgi:3-oxoacyl-[acyl-carrier-protein] synthase-3